MHRDLKRKLGVSLILGCLILTGAVFTRLNDPAGLEQVRHLTFDLYQRIKPRLYDPQLPVRIVDLDEASLQAIGQWPWPRYQVARLVDRLNDLGAAAIVFDVMFSEADRSTPRLFARDINYADILDEQRMIALLSRLPDYDTMLANAFTTAPVVTGWAISPEPNTVRPDLKAAVSFAGSNPAEILPSFNGAVRALPLLEAAARGTGNISLSQSETGGVIRRIPMLASDGTRTYPGLAVEALRVAQQAGTIITRANDASGDLAGGQLAMTALKVGSFEVPLTANGELWVRYTQDRPDRYVSAVDLLDGSVSDQRLASLMAGNIVFVGTSAIGLLDIRTTPLGEQVPGVSIHAQATEQVLSGDYLQRPDWIFGFELFLTIAIGAAMMLILPFVGAIKAGAVGAISVGLSIGASWYAFDMHGLLISPTFPAATGLIVFILVTLALFAFTEQERRFVRGAFGRYVAPALLQRIERDPDKLALGGDLRPMSILFTDIRGFTPLSEQLEPEELVAFLNDLLTPLSDEILAREGTIDKYIGDAIMAFWNAPIEVDDHADRACRAALAMLAKIEAMNAEDRFGFQARGLRGAEIQMGIGINTGQACVGNVGSRQRFNYSVIGDAVNTSARIESACKEVGFSLLVSEATAQAVPGFALLDAGGVEVKGKSEPVRIFAVLGDETLAGDPTFQILERAHVGLMTALDRGDHTRARDLHRACKETATADLSGFYDALAERFDLMSSAA